MESEVLFRRSGYEYRYRIGMDEEMLSSYRAQLGSSGVRRRRRFILEVRTNFILKKSPSDEEIIEESERFASIYPVNLGDIDDGDLDLLVDEIGLYRLSIDYRLEEYWLPEKEIELIAREAMCFVKRTAADPRHASLHVIPVVVYIDVFTLQLQGELLDATVLRLIKPDRLIPFRVWGLMSIVLAEVTLVMDMDHQNYLLKLPKVRVEDVALASARMESCPICSEALTHGTQITPLVCDRVFQNHCVVPRDHVFHNHCIVRWLMNNKTCPVCHSEIAMESS